MSVKVKKNNTRDIWKEMVEVEIRSEGYGEAKTQVVCVNGRNFFVPKDRRVKVPRPVYNVIMRCKKQKRQNERDAEAFERKNAAKRQYVNNYLR